MFLPGSITSGKSLSLEMLKAGWVTTYEQAGAEYGEWGKDEFLRVEAEAKYEHFTSWQLSIVIFSYLPGNRAARRGMWKLGTSSETPAEYKRRHAQAEAVGEGAKSAKQPKPQPQTPPVSWFKRLWGS